MTFYPGATIGILGDGQLARMMASDGRRMGYRVAIYGATPDGPGGQIASSFCVGGLDDAEKACAFARTCDVVTLDTEHVPAELLRAIEQVCPLHPSAATLGIIQDRLSQKQFLQRHGIPQAPFCAIDPADPLKDLATLRFPAIVKTRTHGYDGKGQVRVATTGDVANAVQTLGNRPCILETTISFEREISVILARDMSGTIRFYPIAENDHRGHILHLTRVPARIDAQIARDAERIAAAVADAFDYVGVMAVEMFAMPDGALLVNEIAPRVHNSGHYTLGACVTSQFEQHLRAICGLPLGDTTLLHPAVMVNLLGEDWLDERRAIERAAALSNVKLHLYGKERAEKGRKMGHALIFDPDMDNAVRTATDLVGR